MFVIEDRYSVRNLNIADCTVYDVDSLTVQKVCNETDTINNILDLFLNYIVDNNCSALQWVLYNGATAMESTDVFALDYSDGVVNVIDALKAREEIYETDCSSGELEDNEIIIFI